MFRTRDNIDFNAGQGIAVGEYQTDIGPADYVLFVNRSAVGVIEAKPDDWGHKITTVEEQSEGYAAAKLKWVEKMSLCPSFTRAPASSRALLTDATLSPAHAKSSPFPGPRQWRSGFPSPNRSAHACITSRR